MARVLANTLEGPDHDRIEAMVLAAIDDHPEAAAWSVFILRIRGVDEVYVSIQCRDRVIRSWLFADPGNPIGARIQRDLPRP